MIIRINEGSWLIYSCDVTMRKWLHMLFILAVAFCLVIHWTYIITHYIRIRRLQFSGHNTQETSTHRATKGGFASWEISTEWRWSHQITDTISDGPNLTQIVNRPFIPFFKYLNCFLSICWSTWYLQKVNLYARKQPILSRRGPINQGQYLGYCSNKTLNFFLLIRRVC